MADPEASPVEPRNKKKGNRWRPWVRALHRDIGYLSIGLTLVYALSGLAVNHIADWNPNFTEIERTHQLAGPLVGDDQAVADRVRKELGIEEPTSDLYRGDDGQLELTLAGGTTLHVELQSGKVLEQGEKPRFALRVANWLHLNRGKKAWTLIADGYAVFLLFLALSGLFMIPGRKGLIGRGLVIAGVGAAVPILYVVLSGGP